jgi:hypothetical protein
VRERLLKIYHIETTNSAKSGTCKMNCEILISKFHCVKLFGIVVKNLFFFGEYNLMGCRSNAGYGSVVDTETQKGEILKLNYAKTYNGVPCLLDCAIESIVSSRFNLCFNCSLSSRRLCISHDSC